MEGSKRRHYDIVELSDWMIDQVAALNVAEYGGTLEEKRAALWHLSSAAPSRRGAASPPEGAREREGVAIVALSGDRVVGVQTYRYWPYAHRGEVYHALQSGGTLVHEEHRGQGLFMRMLRAGNAILEEKGVDFLVGFPVPMSFGGFMKDAWSHVDSPMWYLRVLRPLELAKQRLTSRAPLPELPAADDSWIDLEGLRRLGSSRRLSLLSDPAFLRYRYGDGRSTRYAVHLFEAGGARGLVVGKTRASNGFVELVIGDILTTDGRAATAQRTLASLFAELRRTTNVAACSLLLGTGALEHYRLLARFGFAPTFRRGIFIAKALSSRCQGWIADRFRWNLLHADIDTW